MKKSPLASLFTKKMISSSVGLIVPDNESKTEALQILSEFTNSTGSSLKAIEKAYIFGNKLLQKINSNDIQVIEKKNLSKEETYLLNVRTFEHLISQRDAIVSVIENMVQPLMKNVATNTIELNQQSEKILELEYQVNELQRMMSRVYGKAPNIPLLPGNKKIWNANLNEAAKEIVKKYEQDQEHLPKTRKWSYLREASDEFFQSHFFPKRPDSTPDSLYENVKKYVSETRERRDEAR
jgi:hypothetical protein